MKSDEIRVIYKKPEDKTGAVRIVSNTLETFQKMVGGYIEAVPVPGEGWAIICNEEGRLLGFSENIWPDFLHDPIVGPVVIVGIGKEDFEDCPLSMSRWMKLVREWEARA